MKEVMNDVIQLFLRAGHVVVATADAVGTPHIAVAGELTLNDDDKVKVSEWFCPRTTANLLVNNRISLAVWDRQYDRGYQIEGTVDAVHDRGILNGYAEESEIENPVPQALHDLIVKVRKINEFRHAHHSDMNLLQAQDQP